MHIAYPCMQNTEETIAKYAVDANLFQLGFTNPKKNIQALDIISVNSKLSKKTVEFYFFKNVFIFEQKENF